MPKKSNQKIKILYLMDIFKKYTDNEHGITLDAISNHLFNYGVEAERKTLYDDINVLRAYGMDIEMRKGKEVAYYLASGDFELPELKLLVDAVQSSKFITHKKSNQLIKKLESFAGVYGAAQLQRQVFVANRIKTMNESIYYTVDYISEAITKNLKVEFKYFDWNTKKEKQLRHNGKTYIISPFALTWDDENYYMIGYDSDAKKIKHYRVDKMLNINISSQKRQGTELFNNFDTALYSKKTFGMYGGNEQAVTLRCKKHLAGVMLDRFGLDSAVIFENDDIFDLRININISPVFLSWLMNFGDDVIIVSPQNVKEQFILLANKALSAYK